MQKIARMNPRSILLLSSSTVFGYDYLEYAKSQLIGFLEKKNVKTILFIPFALPDHDKYTELLRTVLTPWGYMVEGIHTKADGVDAVRSAEAIFVGGGNTFVLLKTLYERDLMDALRGAVLQRGTPYIGSSAGTNVATRSIHTTNDMPMMYPPSFDALRLVPFNINPHYLDTTETQHKGETRDERLAEFLTYHNRPVLGLREGSAVLVVGDTALLVGNRGAKLFRPNEEPIELAPNVDLSFLLQEN